MLARRLRAARQARGWTLERAAEEVGVGVAAVRRMEGGNGANPSLAVLVSAAHAYGLDVWELLGPDRPVAASGR